MYIYISRLVIHSDSFNIPFSTKTKTEKAKYYHRSIFVAVQVIRSTTSRPQCVTHGNVHFSTISVLLCIVFSNVPYFFCKTDDPQNVTIVLRSVPPRVSYSGAKSSVHNRKIAKLETTCESQEFISRATAEVFTGLVEVL